LKLDTPVILCVDDEPGNLKLLERTLGTVGYLVLRAGDGREALAIIGSRRVDLVITDVMMPGLDGWETCRRIKADERYRHIPVIMITGLGSKADRIRGIEAGVDDFLAKPFDHVEVLARVKMLLRTKTLDELLDSSFNSIQDMISFGNQIMGSFTPAGFDLMSQVDSLANQAIRKDAELAGRPSTVLVRICNGHSLAWYRYVHVAGRLERSGIDLGTLPGAAEWEPGASFCNGPGARTGFGTLLDRLALLGIEVENLACYLGNMVSVLALNYGREATRFDAALLESLAMQTLFFSHLAIQIGENDDAFAYTVHSLARAAEVNDEDTGNHILRVGEYCAVLVQELRLGERLADALRLQATLHDVGKIHMPGAILKKPGALCADEWDIMKLHTVNGAKIIGDHPRFASARELALSHHERWDGSGYPFGLSGEGIPLAGRITNIADQYDALRNARVYKPALSHDATVRILCQGDGRTMPQHFDPQVLQAFMATAASFAAVYEKLAPSPPGH